MEATPTKPPLNGTGGNSHHFHILEEPTLTIVEEPTLAIVEEPKLAIVEEPTPDYPRWADVSVEPPVRTFGINTQLDHSSKVATRFFGCVKVSTIDIKLS